MRVIHTSDWHLGKTLEGFSRIEEQEKFIDEFMGIVDSHQVDLVIIAGDIYDNGNPPARAEMLFYNALKRISRGGERAVLVIAGNHDSPERLEAVAPLAYEHGVVILGTPKSCSFTGRCGRFEVLAAGEGFIEVQVGEEKAVIVTMPYPSEKRLEEILTDNLEESERQKSYSERVGEIFEKLSENYREDTINIAVSHLFLLGGESTDSERPIQLGGSFAVEKSKLPKKAQYVALGHLHKTQCFDIENIPVIYSGSPIQYSKSEKNNSNGIYIVDLKAREKAKVERVLLKNYKPIEVWKCESIEEALKKCAEDGERDLWTYLEIKTNRVLLQEEIKEMKKLRRDIIEIKPIMEGLEEDMQDFENITEKSMDVVFKEFYKREKNAEPSQEIVDLFLSIVLEEGEGEEIYETAEA